VTTAADLDNYPRPRKRGVGVDLADLGVPAPAPRMRYFPFHFAQGGPFRWSFSLGRVRGPAIIKGLELYPHAGGDPPSITLEVGTAQLPVNEVNAPLGSPKPYLCLTEFHDPFGLTAGAAGDGIPLGTMPNTHTRYQIPLDLIVTEGEFYPVIATCNAGAAVFSITGALRVLEAVDPEALRFFL